MGSSPTGIDMGGAEPHGVRETAHTSGHQTREREKDTSVAAALVLQPEALALCLSSAEEQLQPLLGADQGRRGAAGTGQALAPALESTAVSAAGTAMQETSVLFPLRVAAPPHGWGLPGNKFHW